MLVDLLLDLLPYYSQGALVAKKLVMGKGACATFSIAPSFPAAPTILKGPPLYMDYSEPESLLLSQPPLSWALCSYLLCCAKCVHSVNYNRGQLLMSLVVLVVLLMP